MGIFSKKSKTVALGKGVTSGRSASDVADLDDMEIVAAPLPAAPEIPAMSLPLPDDVDPQDAYAPTGIEEEIFETQAKSKRGWGRGSKEPKAPKVKITAQKDSKESKLGRFKKPKIMGRNDTESIAEDNRRLSNRVMIEFYPGLAKEDAIATARHWAINHMENPSNCFYYVQKIRDGFAIEVQEGVGRAYLPNVIDTAMKYPGRIVVVPMVRRKLTVFFSSRLSDFEAQVLPEGQDPPTMAENPPIVAERTSAMTPVMKQHTEWMYVGVLTALIGGVSLLASIAFFALDPAAKVPPEWRTTDIGQLPVMQWGRLQADATDSYVVRLEYQDNQWRIVRQAVGASVDVQEAPTDPSAAPIVGGAIPPTGPGQQIPPPQGGPASIPPPPSAPQSSTPTAN